MALEQRVVVCDMLKGTLRSVQRFADRPFLGRVMPIKSPKAFDDAWAQLQSAQTEPAMASLVRTALAKRIIEMAERPGRNAQKLREDAIAYVQNNPLWPAV